MGKKNNKHVVKLRLLSSVNGVDGSSPRWAPVSNREFTNDEKQGIRKIIGNVYFHDELDDTNFEHKNLYNEISIHKNKINNDLDTDIFKDNYFPDDGYDYEQHLCTIKKSGINMNSAPKDETNLNPKSLLLNTTSILSNSEIDVNKDEFVSELVELANCLEEPDGFEELNDDFILDMTGLKNKYELDRNIDINDILWGGGKLQSNYKGGIQRLDNELNQSELLTQNFDSSSIFSEENYNNESDKDLFENVLNEYSDNISTLEDKNEFSVKIKNKLDISEYEHILDRYINQARSRNFTKSKPEKSYSEVNMPLDKVQVEKIISILENTEICDNSSEVTLSDVSEFESTEKVSKNFPQASFEVINRPNKVEILSYYSRLNLKGQTKCPASTQQKILFENEGPSHDQGCNYNSNASIITFLPLRRKDETSEDRRNRKQAVKQAKREMRDLKRKNKQDTKNIKKSVVESFINSNNDIKNGVRYFRF